MNTTKITKTNDGWMVTVSGQVYGEYKTLEKAQEIANSFKGTMAN